MKPNQVSPTVGPDSVETFSPPVVAALFVGLITVASIPIITHALPPLADYINHLARSHVINVIDLDPDLARFYKIDWQFLPNLMMDLIVPVLSQFMGIYLAGQIFTIMAFVLIASGTLVLNRALFGHWSALPLISLPFLYNGVLLVGVMNYVFGIGLALWGLAAWIALRDHAWAWRFAASSIFVLSLYVCHLFAAGLYGLGLLAFELQRLRSARAEPLWPRLVDFTATGLPFIPIMALLLASPTWNAPGSPAYWEIWGKYEGLILAINIYYLLLAFALIGVIFLAAIYAWKYQALRFHPVGWTILGVSVIVYLVMPRSLFAAHLADQRLPVAVVFMLSACFDVDMRRRAARGALVALITLLLAARVVEVQLVWNHLAHDTEAFFQSVKSIKRGARVLVVHDDRSLGKEISDFGLVHAASLATIERSALVTTAFTVRGKHILQVRKEFSSFVESEDRWPPSVPYFVQAAESASTGVSYFWDSWSCHFDYVYILFTLSTPNPDSRHLEMIYNGPSFQLYRVIRPQSC